MPALIIYLLKVNIALVLFYMAYRLALRHLTFYTLNRFFLLFAIIFSSAYPIVDFPGVLKKNEIIGKKIIAAAPDWHYVQQQIVPSAPEFDYWSFIITIFWAGVVFMGIRLLIRLASLYRIHSLSEIDVYNGLNFRRIIGKVNPFSFLQNIYLNPLQHTSEELIAILQHENVHVKGWHTLDVLLAEINKVFYWFNPGVWMISRAVKENLEFITDRAVLLSGVDSKKYQYSLLEISTLSPAHSLVNNFNLHDIKKRIMMMNKKRSSNAQISRYAFMLPLIMLFSFIFTVSKAELESTNFDKLLTKAKKVMPLEKMTTPFIEVNMPEKINLVVGKPVPDTSVIQQLNAQGIEQPRYIVDGEVQKDFVAGSIKPENIQSMSVYKGVAASEKYGTLIENAERGVIEITTKNHNPLRIVLDGPRPDPSKKPLFIIDGVVQKLADKPNIKPDDIESISVLKSDEALKYGPDAKHGVIIIKSKIPAPVIPQEFSPNNDGVNDLLVITGLEKFKPVSIEITDNSGNVVFEQSDYKNDWNGKTLDGKNAKTGKYTVKINTQDRTKGFLGTVNIIR